MSPRTIEQLATVKADRKQTILDAALVLFTEESYHGASVSKIASRAGVSKGLMYNYFESKEEVLKNLLSSLFKKVADSMDLFSKEPINDKLVIRHINQTFELIDKDRDMWKLYFSMNIQKDVMELAKTEMLSKMQPYLEAMMLYFKEKGSENPTVTLQYF